MTTAPPAARPARRSFDARPLVRLVRPRQWVKNGFVLLPLLFSGRWTDPAAVGLGLLFAAAFTACAAAVYCLNDVLDAAADRRHPRKRSRPVASGAVRPGTALALAGVLAGGGLGVAAAAVSVPAAGLLAVYLGMNLGYCWSWKHKPLLDVMTIAAGFLLRVIAGSLAVGAAPSPWLVTCTTFLALVLALAKRRQEVARGGTDGPARAVLAHYPLPLLDQLIAGMVPATLLTYMLYAFSVHPPVFLATAGFVAYGLFRYLYLLHTRADGEQPEEVLLTDPPTLVNVLLWAATSAALVWRYGPAAG